MKQNKYLVRRGIAAVLAAASIFCLCSCGKTEQHGDESTEKVSLEQLKSSTPKHVNEEVTENLTIDADVHGISDTAKSLDSFLVEPSFYKKKAEAEKIVEQLLGEQKYSVEEYDETSHDFHPENAKLDDETVYIGDGSLYFTTERGFYLKQTFVCSPLEDKAIDAATGSESEDNTAAFTKKRLDFMSPEQAEATVQKELSKMKGLTLNEKSSFYCLDKETLKSQEQVRLKKGLLKNQKSGETHVKDAWSADDESYFMLFCNGLNGIPVCPYSLGESGENATFVESSYVRVLYSRDGIEDLQICSPYQVVETTQTNDKVLSLNAAIDLLKQKYQDYFLEIGSNVHDIQFCYAIAQGGDGLIASPAWSFLIREFTAGEDSNTPHESFKPVVFDAVTGREYANDQYSF